MPTTPTPSAPRGGNLLALAITQVVITVTALAVQVGLARVLGDDSYGSYRFLAMLAGMFGFFADFSIPTLLARQVARAESTAAERLGTGLGAVAMLAVAPIGLTVAYTALADGRGWMIIAAIAAGSTMGALASRGVTESIFQGLRRMQPLVLANAVGRVVYLGGVVLALSLGAGIAGVFAAAAAGPIVSAAILVFRFVREVGRPAVPQLRQITALIHDGVPFGLHRAFMGLYLAGDLLVIQAFWGEAELGAYGVATLLLIQLPVADVLVRAAYPTLARAVGDLDRAGEIVGRLLRVLLTLGLPIAVGGVWVAPDLVPAVFGEDYRSAIPLFCVVLWALPLRFANGAASGALAALDRQPTRTRAIVAIALFNLVMNGLWVPFYGAMGAAVTTVISEVFLTLWLGLSLRGAVRNTQWWQGPARAIVPLGAMVAVLWVMGGLPVFGNIVAGAVVYGGFSWVLGGWSTADLRALRRW